MSAELSERRIRNKQIRRRRELRHHFRMCLLTLMLAVSFSLIFFSFRTKAQGQDEEILYKYYKSVIVEDGDTLWNYACQYGDVQYYNSHSDYINEVIHINSLSEDKITSGQYLILPYYSSEFIS